MNSDKMVFLQLGIYSHGAKPTLTTVPTALIPKGFSVFVSQPSFECAKESERCGLRGRESENIRKSLLQSG